MLSQTGRIVSYILSGAANSSHGKWLPQGVGLFGLDTLCYGSFSNEWKWHSVQHGSCPVLWQPEGHPRGNPSWVGCNHSLLPKLASNLNLGKRQLQLCWIFQPLSSLKRNTLTSFTTLKKYVLCTTLYICAELLKGFIALWWFKKKKYTRSTLYTFQINNAHWAYKTISRLSSKENYKEPRGSL